MGAKVVDASALSALILGEPAAEAVADELGQDSLLAPALIEYEVGNTCWKKMRRHPASADILREAFALLPRLDLRLHDPEPRRVLALAVERGVTYYDASYLWLAESLRLPLVSLDQRLLAARR